MAINQYYDVYIGGKLHKSHKKTAKTTVSSLLGKYKGEPGLTIKQRTEKTIETIESKCEGGKCPVKVTY